uniref:Transposase n=1 Tax=Ralstonia solanacearum CFBP2957 TaxID=859656 RepID=D8P552_RALSL|nr:protein of unknown function [Ralstonia solanacearum CFBP2957]
MFQGAALTLNGFPLLKRIRDRGMHWRGESRLSRAKMRLNNISAFYAVILKVGCGWR